MIYIILVFEIRMIKIRYILFDFDYPDQGQDLKYEPNFNSNGNILN